MLQESTTTGDVYTITNIYLKDNGLRGTMTSSLLESFASLKSIDISSTTGSEYANILVMPSTSSCLTVDTCYRAGVDCQLGSSVNLCPDPLKEANKNSLSVEAIGLIAMAAILVLFIGGVVFYFVKVLDPERRALQRERLRRASRRITQYISRGSSKDTVANPRDTISRPPSSPTVPARSRSKGKDAVGAVSASAQPEISFADQPESDRGSRWSRKNKSRSQPKKKDEFEDDNHGGNADEFSFTLNPDPQPEPPKPAAKPPRRKLHESYIDNSNSSQASGSPALQGSPEFKPAGSPMVKSRDAAAGASKGYDMYFKGQKGSAQKSSADSPSMGALAVTPPPPSNFPLKTPEASKFSANTKKEETTREKSRDGGSDEKEQDDKDDNRKSASANKGASSPSKAIPLSAVYGKAPKSGLKGNEKAKPTTRTSLHPTVQGGEPVGNWFEMEDGDVGATYFVNDVTGEFQYSFSR